MNQNYKKKLIEVAIPLEAINIASAREKSIRHGHPSTLHLWWARRPLAACRAVLFAQLVDDPSSHPDKFPTEEAVEAERKRLFQIIEELVLWENSTNEEVLERARAEIRKSCGGELPPVYDPFSGGGSIPLEAQRLGLPAYGSDLNPVAVMIGKAMIEIPPKFKDKPPVHPGGAERNHYHNAEGLAEDVKYYGEWMREKAFERIGHLYPQVDLPKEYGGGKATVIAWIWARTVPSPDPAFSDVQVPIASSFLLNAKKGAEVWAEPIVDRTAKTIAYKIRHGGTKEELDRAKEGTKASRGANFRCIISNTAITPDFTKESGSSGKMGSELIAIVAKGKNGRIYIEPSSKHVEVARSANPLWRPETPLPGDMRAFWTPPYGIKTFGDLFTNRQLVALNTLSDLIHEARQKIEHDAIMAGLDSDEVHLRDGGVGGKSYAEAVSIYLSLVCSKFADLANAHCVWEPVAQCPRNLFGRQAIPMQWTFVEGNIFSESSGGFSVLLNGVFQSFVKNTYNYPKMVASIKQMDAASFELKKSKSVVVNSDPPYYDNIGYADLSDFFYVWLRKSLFPVYPEIFSFISTPKSEEMIASPHRHGGSDAAEEFFLVEVKKAIARMALNQNSDFPAAIYYAFKSSEIEKEGITSKGWATFLQAIMDSGFYIVRTWPMRTEMTAGLKAKINALATSVVLVCQKKKETTEIISRAEFIRLLKRELPPAIAELQAANIAPADMPQSAIGPGMGVFSRYKAVLESDDSPMSVKTALQLINHELDEFLNNITGEFDPETRFAISWFEQNGMGKGEYGIANSLATARGISVESVKHAGIVESAAGKVRILKRDELLDDWDPETDKHLTIWECCQYLIRALEKDGEYEAALLLKKTGSEKAEAVKDLAYCLYDICSNKRKDAKEATSYNALIAIWTDLTRLAATIHDVRGDGQLRMQV